LINVISSTSFYIFPELERFIVNVEGKGENANNIKRQLLTACFRSQNLDKTLQVIEKLETEKFQIPIGVYAQLIDLYTHHKKSAEALENYEKLKAKDATFKLDNLKTVRLADLLLQEERVALSHTNDYASFIRCVRQIHEGLQFRQGKEEEAEPVEGGAAASADRSTPDVVGAIVQEASIYFRRDRAATLEKILKGLVKQGLSISSAKASQLSEQLGSELTPRISELLGKLSSGELQPVALPNNGKRSLDSLSIDG